MKHLLSMLTLALATLTACTCPSPSERAWAEIYPEIERHIVAPTFPERNYDIRDFGAQAGIACHEAINAAIAKCNAEGGGHVIVPAGEWLTGAITLLSNVDLHLEEGATLLFSDNLDHYPIVRTRWEGMDCYNYSPMIYAIGQENIAVTGLGTLDGGASVKNWWSMVWNVETDWEKERRNTQRYGRPLLQEWMDAKKPVEERVMGHGYGMRPQLVSPFECKNILIEGVTMIRSPFWNLHPVFCENITVRDVKFNNDGPNGDGCDPESCNYVLIEDCYFNTGDDCIAIKSGRDGDARAIDIPSQNMIVRNCEMKNGHGGVVIGSEIGSGYRNLFVENCVMDSPELDRAIRIKTNARRGGVIEHVYVRNVTVGQCKESVLKINLIYDQKSVGDATDYPVVQDVYLENMTSQKSRYGVCVTALENVNNIHNISVKNCRFENLEKEESISGQCDPIQYENVEMVLAAAE